MDARTPKHVGLAVAVLLGTAVFSGAGTSLDVPLPGTRIRLNDTAGPAGRRTYVALRDGDQSLPLPDPRVTGATVIIGRVGVGDVTVLDLPPEGWGGGTTPRRDYKFKSKGGTVVAARIIAGHSVRISARGDDAYPLGGTPQGAVGMIVDVGGVRFCGLFGGIVTKDDGEAFRARRAPAPNGCPLLGTTTTTTTTSTTTTTTSTTTTSTTTTSTTTTTMIANPGVVVTDECTCSGTEPNGEPCDQQAFAGSFCSAAGCPGSGFCTLAFCRQRLGDCSASATIVAEPGCSEGPVCDLDE